MIPYSDRNQNQKTGTYFQQNLILTMKLNENCKLSPSIVQTFILNCNDFNIYNKNCCFLFFYKKNQGFYANLLT